MPVYTIESNTNIVGVAGLYKAQYAITDTDGFPMGPTGSIAQGAHRGMGIHVGVKKAGGPAGEPRVVDQTGDDGTYLQKFIFGSTKIGEMDLTFEVDNMDFYAAISNLKVFQIGEWNGVGIETDTVPTARTCFVFNSQAKDADADFGDVRWVNMFYPLVTTYPLFEAVEEAKSLAYPYRGAPVRAAVTPWQVAFTKATHGFTRAARFKLISRYPLTMHTFVGNASATVITLDYSPSTDDTGYGMWVWKEGTLLTRTVDYTVNIATKKITLNGTAPTAGQRILVLYEAFDI